jgi:hypothetical protein
MQVFSVTAGQDLSNYFSTLELDCYFLIQWEILLISSRDKLALWLLLSLSYTEIIFPGFYNLLIAFSPVIIHSYPIMNCQLSLTHLIVFKCSGEVAANATLLTMKFRVYSL